VREAILRSLTAIADDVAVSGLLECLHSEDVALRNGTIDAMKELPEAVAPIMSALLCDGDSDARIFAVNVLESLRHCDVESWLLTVIEQDPHVNVCATAVDILCEVATPAAVAPLEKLKARFPDEPYIQFAADLALSRLGDG
jgi:HEAT repeat protein